LENIELIDQVGNFWSWWFMWSIRPRAIISDILDISNKLDDIDILCNNIILRKQSKRVVSLGDEFIELNSNSLRANPVDSSNQESLRVSAIQNEMRNIIKIILDASKQLNTKLSNNNDDNDTMPLMKGENIGSIYDIQALNRGTNDYSSTNNNGIRGLKGGGRNDYYY
jgi:hypothetical protein